MYTRKECVSTGFMVCNVRLYINEKIMQLKKKTENRHTKSRAELVYLKADNMFIIALLWLPLNGCTRSLIDGMRVKKEY